MIIDHIRIAVSSLLKRKLRAWLTLIGVFIGITAVVALIGLGEGLRNAVTGQFNLASAEAIIVQASGTAFGPPGQGAVDPLQKKYVKKLERIPGADQVIGRLMVSGVLEFNNNIVVGFATSMPDGEKRNTVYDILSLKPQVGRMLKDGDKNKLILGYNFYKNEDKFGKRVVPGDKVLLNDKEFEVVGIMEEKGSFIIDNIVAVNEGPLRDLIDEKEETSIIVVLPKDPNKINNLKGEVEKTLRKERDVKEGEENFVVQTTTQTLEQLNSAIFGVQLFVYIIAMVSILVGGIGIMNTMYTSVLERTREIGVMKAMGATNGTIFTLFAIESGFLGMIGGVVGAAGGAGVAYGMAFIGKTVLNSQLIQAKVSPALIIGAILFAFIVGTFAGISPAWKASRMHPVDALRFTK